MNRSHHDLTRHTGALRRFTRALCCGEAEAEDVSQEALLAALEGHGVVKSSWPRWLRGVARNVARSERRSAGRRRQREGAYARPEAVPSTAERVARLELEMRLIELVRDLPEGQSEVLFLRFWEGLPPRTIATRSGLSLEAVKTRLKRALAALRSRLTEESPGGREEWMGALGFAPLVGSLTSDTVLGTTVGGVVMKKLALLTVISLVAIGVWGVWGAGEELGPTAPEAPHPGEVAALTLEAPVVPPDPIEPTAAPARVPVVGNTTVITGRIMNHPTGDVSGEGEPAAGVQLHLRLSFYLRGMPDPEAKTVSEADGSFRLELILDSEKPRFYAVTTEGDDDYQWIKQDVKVGGDEPRAIEMLLHRYAHGDLRGTVVDLEGDPIEGVAVQVGDADGEAALTDDSGAFCFEKHPNSGQITALKTGWSVVESARARQQEDGSWKEVRLTLAPTGVLRVRVEDSAGQPVKGVRLSVEPSPAERYGTEETGSRTDEHRSLSPIDPGDGEAPFFEVWRGMKLRIHLLSTTGEHSFERELDGVALPLRERDTGRPILVDSDAEHTVIIRLAPVRRITGWVVRPDDTPVAGAYVNLQTVEQVRYDPAFVDMTARTDETGRFALYVKTLTPAGPAQLSASDSEGFYFSWDEGAAPLAASMPLDLRVGHEDLTLVLEPTFAITGRVIGPDGEGRGAHVSVTPVVDTLVPGLLSTGFHGSALTEDDGGFTMAGLPEGIFDVVFFHQDYAPVRLTDVAAGTSDLVVRLEEEPTNTVEIEVIAPGCELEQVIVLHGTLLPIEEGAVLAPNLPANADFDEPFGWPETALGLWYGTENDSTELGHCTYQYWPIEGMSKTFHVREGYCWFGAKARTKSGEKLFPIGTGLVRVTSGTYRLRFELRPTTPVEGHVLGIPAEAELHAAISTFDGRLLPIDVRREYLGPTLELGAAGDFRFPAVPVGHYELRLGTRLELLAGESQLHEAIEVRRGEPLDLVLEL